MAHALQNQDAYKLFQYMLPIKSKYKVAKRLGGSIFEQTQTQKFALSEARSAKKVRRGRGASDYNRQLLEKQRLRYTYGISERQLANYAKKAYMLDNPTNALHAMLEMRADSVVYRAGIAPTRRAARQLVSHGHITINGKRITTPSHRVEKGDILSIREGSRTSPLFTRFSDEEGKIRPVPGWLSFDLPLMKVEVLNAPVYGIAETSIDYSTVFEFYSR